jgi:hypothetical protein
MRGIRYKIMTTLANFGEDGAPRQARHGAAWRLLALPLVFVFAVVFLMLGYVFYVLWPRWPEAPAAHDAPSRPVTVAGVAFNIPPAAIRVAVQRRSGAHERIDLAYLWPSLTPPDAASKAGPAVPAAPGNRIFLTIAASSGALSPAGRFKTIYPRYTDANIKAGPGGLALMPFRDGTPYQSEDLLFDPAAPERFLMRCTRKDRGPMPGMCLHERRIGQADITVRFPRDWLDDWGNVLAGIERLIAQMQPRGG